MENSPKSIVWPLIVVFLLILLVVGALVGYWVIFRSERPAVEPRATIEPLPTAIQEEPAEPTTAPLETPEPPAPTPKPPTATPEPPTTTSEPPTATPEPPTPTPEPPTATPTEMPGEPMSVLVLGIDTSSKEDEADAIYVVAVDPASGAVDVTIFAPSMLMTAHGGENRLEWIWQEAFYGPSGDDEMAVSAVAVALDLNFGIAPDHYAVVRDDSLDTMGNALDENLTTPETLLNLPTLLGQILADDAVLTDLETHELLDLAGILEAISEDEITVTVVPADGLG